MLQDRERLADGRPRQLGVLNQLALRGKLLPKFPAAREDFIAESFRQQTVEGCPRSKLLDDEPSPVCQTSVDLES